MIIEKECISIGKYGLFVLEKQHLVYQVRSILKTDKLSKVEIKDRKRQIKQFHVDSVEVEVVGLYAAEDEVVIQSADNVLLQEVIAGASGYGYVEHTHVIESESESDITQGLKELLEIEDCVSDERKSLALYALGSNENLINAAAAELKLKKFISIQDRQERRKERLVEWKEKALRKKFLRETESTDDRNKWECLKRGEKLTSTRT